MSKIRSRHSRPEVLFRIILHRLGFRFRLNSRMAGRPDVVLKRHKVAVFVHGCFWHRHKGCKRATIPSSNLEYWTAKLKRNQENDKKNMLRIARMGWRPYVVWECEIMKDPQAAAKKVFKFITGKKLFYALPEKKKMIRVAEERRAYLLRQEK